MKLTPLLLLSLSAAGSLFAGTDTTTTTSTSNLENAVAPPDQSIFDKIWSIPQLYKNDANPYIEEFDLIGRFQFDYFHISSDRGNRDFSEIRRMRFGVDSFFLDRHIEFKAELDTNEDQYNTPSVFYNRFTNLFIKFHANDAFNLTVGKMEPHFGYDREVSDTLQPFFERTFFDDQFMPGLDYTAAVAASGKVNNFGYLAAVYSNEYDKEFGSFNGGESILAEINYDFSHAMNADKALWVFDYLSILSKDTNTNIFQSFNNGVATYFDYKKGRWGFVTQLGYGNGIASKGDIYEVMVMPTFDITEKLQVEFRYQLGLASQSNGITTYNRQEKTLGHYTGDEYNAPYLGLNYFIYGYKLRLMAGVQYGSLTGGTGASAGYNGWTTMVGIRMFF